MVRTANSTTGDRCAHDRIEPHDAGQIGAGETLTTTYVGPEWATAVPYVVIFVVLLMRPQGLMGARLREDVAL